MNTDYLRKLINNFELGSNPSNADSSGLCTNEDIRKVVRNVSKLLRDIVDELDSNSY